MNNTQLDNIFTRIHRIHSLSTGLTSEKTNSVGQRQEKKGKHTEQDPEENQQS